MSSSERWAAGEEGDNPSADMVIYTGRGEGKQLRGSSEAN